MADRIQGFGGTREEHCFGHLPADILEFDTGRGIRDKLRPVGIEVGTEFRFGNQQAFHREETLESHREEAVVQALRVFGPASFKLRMVRERLGDKRPFRKEVRRDAVHLGTSVGVKFHGKFQIFGIYGLVIDPRDDLFAATDTVAAGKSQPQKRAEEKNFLVH